MEFMKQVLPRFLIPTWPPVSGKRTLLSPEQGMGKNIARYVFLMGNIWKLNIVCTI